MCSWCWGYRPTWRRIEQALEHQVIIAYHTGGLAADSDAPMPQPMRQNIAQIWHKIQAQLGTEFNFDFWEKCTPRRSTYQSCRAVLVAKRFGLEKEMIHAIQEAYYLRAKNPSDTSTLVALGHILGLNCDDFLRQLESEDIQHELMREISLGHSWGIQGFPSLILEHEGERIPIPLNYADETPTLDYIQQTIENYR